MAAAMAIRASVPVSPPPGRHPMMSTAAAPHTREMMSRKMFAEKRAAGGTAVGIGSVANRVVMPFLPSGRAHGRRGRGEGHRLSTMIGMRNCA